jgi:hypothetical protein
MIVARIALLLIILGAIRLVLTGFGHEGLLIAIIGFAIVLGFLDRRLKPLPLRHRPLGREGASVDGIPEDDDEGRSA